MLPTEELIFNYLNKQKVCRYSNVDLVMTYFKHHANDMCDIVTSVPYSSVVCPRISHPKLKFCVQNAASIALLTSSITAFALILQIRIEIPDFHDTYAKKLLPRVGVFESDWSAKI